MEDCLRGRFSEDIKYVDSFLGLLSLIDAVSVNDAVDQMLSKILLSLPNVDMYLQTKQGNELQCLRLALLSKFRLLEVNQKTSGLKLNSCRCILRLSFSERSSLCSIPNFDALEISLWLLNNEEFIEISSDIMQMLKKCLGDYLVLGTCTFENVEISPSCFLNLLETTISVFSKKCSMKDATGFGITKLLNEQNVDDLLVELAVHDNRIISINTLTKIFPIIVDSSPSHLLLIKLWARLKQVWKGDNWEEVEYTKVYLVLSSLANYFFPNGILAEGEENCILVNDNKFWEIILFGIGQKHAIIRKQCRFILRKALDFASSNSALVCMHVSTGLFYWHVDRSNEFCKLWNDYFLILEALEEKQVHLIAPVLSTFENFLMSDLNLCISAAWNLPIYQRMFSHDSNFIVKYGLRLFFTQTFDLSASSNANIVSFLLYPFLQTLNNTYLYVKQESNEFGMTKGLKLLLVSIINTSKEICHSFFTKILVRLCEIPWGPVPLFYIMKSLSSVDFKGKFWEASSLKYIKLFLTNTLQTHSVYIRGAIQCCMLKAMVNFLNSEKLDIFYLTDVIGAFCQDESLKRGSYSWNVVVNWLKNIFDHDKAVYFVAVSLSQLNDHSLSTSSINIKALARMYVLLFDASFILVGSEMNQLKTFHCSMHPLLKHLESVETRLYVSKTLVNYGIHFLNCIVEECHALPENDITHRVITAAVTCFLEDVILYFRRRLFHVRDVDDFNSFTLYLKVLHTFSNEKKILPHLLKFSDGLVDDAFHVLELQKDTILCRYFAVKILCWIGNLLTSSESYFRGNILLKIKSKLSSYVKHVLTTDALNKKSCDITKDVEDFGDIHIFKGKITSEYIKSHWLILYLNLKVDSQSEEMILAVRNFNLLTEDAIESIEIGGREVLSPIMSVFKVLLPQAMEHSFDLAVNFSYVCWKATFEHRKSDFFWIAIENFIQMIFQTKIMLMPRIEKHIVKFSQQLHSHGQTVGRIFSIFVDHLYEETFKCGPIIWRKYCSVLIDVLTYGPVLRKDQRIYKDTCEYIQSFGPEYTVNWLHSCDTSVRVKGIAILLFIMKTERKSAADESKTENLIAQLSDSLWEKVIENSDVKSRYYGNSQVHRLKQRAMQSLLILEPSLNEERSEHLMVSLCESLLIESHQPSVKYLQEWLLVRILIHHPNLRGKKMWKIFQQVGSKRTGCMGSFIAVAYHLAKSLSQVEQEPFIMECMQHILPWCMAQQFGVRLYAQIVMQKLWDLVVTHNFKLAKKEYKVSYECFSSGLDQGNNTQKNLQKLKENFYFNVFNPIDHFSIETIYYDIPRLANVSVDEWISVAKFEAVELHSILPLKNSDNLLREHSTGEWVMKSIDCGTSIATVDKNTNLQKKIMPWKFCVPQSDIEYSMEDSDNMWRRNHGRGYNQEKGLVVVASLIDRMPNLGGLCRTCEAFSVSEYVLGSLKYIEDRQFQNLSVSAERWIPISEVKPFMLASYLKSMKDKGYSLIGAEQTASSITLNKFKFAEKSLLLLGNEKDGVPADLLPLLDVCVEVPQQGLIRSLNVHVTGAIFAWEYLRQNSSNI